jgi:hypothetical protein
VTLVAVVSERKVVVIASGAGPVACSLSSLLGGHLGSNLLHSLPLGISVLSGLAHVRGHTVGILVGLGLLAPEALFPALEIVVLALGALPASFGELEVTPLWEWRQVIRVRVGAARSGGVLFKVECGQLQ